MKYRRREEYIGSSWMKACRAIGIHYRSTVEIRYELISNVLLPREIRVYFDGIPIIYPDISWMSKRFERVKHEI